MAKRSLRFDDVTLQENFLSELRRRNIRFELTDERAVECSDSEWNDVNNVTHTIRDSCFQWYFTWLPSAEMSNQFLALARRSGLPFQLEHHENGDIFLLPKEHKAKFEELGWQVCDANGSLEK
jgi:hypothetical protein